MVIAAPVMAAATNLAASSCVTFASTSSSVVVHSPHARERRDLEAEFEYWAAESLEIANATFEAQAEAVRES